MRAGQRLMQLLAIGAYSYWMLPGANGLSLSYCRKWMGPANTPNTAHYASKLLAAKVIMQSSVA